MVINRDKLLELGACKEAVEWIGNREFEFSVVGVQQAKLAGVGRWWLRWILSKMDCHDLAMWDASGYGGAWRIPRSAPQGVLK